MESIAKNKISSAERALIFVRRRSKETPERVSVLM